MAGMDGFIGTDLNKVEHFLAILCRSTELICEYFQYFDYNVVMDISRWQHIFTGCSSGLPFILIIVKVKVRRQHS